MKIKLRYKGGIGSGNFEHSGRPGEVGGSAGGTGDGKQIQQAIERIHSMNYQQNLIAIKLIKQLPQGTRVVDQRGNTGKIDHQVISNQTSHARLITATRVVWDKGGKPSPWNGLSASFYDAIDPELSWHIKTGNVVRQSSETLF